MVSKMAYFGLHLVPKSHLGHHQVVEAIWSPFGHGTCVHLYYIKTSVVGISSIIPMHSSISVSVIPMLHCTIVAFLSQKVHNVVRAPHSVESENRILPPLPDLSHGASFKPLDCKISVPQIF